MKCQVPFDELSYGNGEKQIQFLHANAHVPETYRKLLEGIGFEDFNFVLPLQRPLWRDSDPEDLRHWSLLARDIIQHMDACDRKGIIGIGHSMGAIATWLAAVERPDLFSQIILIDPVVLPKKWVKRLSVVPFWMKKRLVPMVKIAANRRDHWPDEEALESHLGSKKVYQGFDKDVWNDFKKYSIVDSEDGGIQLRYPRLWESKVYASAPNIWKLMGYDPCPITIIRGQESDVITSDTWDAIHEEMPHANLVEMENVGHLVPFEQPLQLAKMVQESIN